jgi:peptidoglycan/xylan/chitin deacetylase (PgdA/CDA1 family)
MRSARAIARDLAFRHVGGTALILIYHRVADLERNIQALAVGRANFATQMDVLAREYDVVSIDELARALKRRHVANRTVAVTFDDGYEDNLLNAAPVLAQAGVPATVYINSGLLGGRREFWWDELEQLVFSPGTLPARLEVPAPWGTLQLDLGEYATYTEEQAAADLPWTAIEPPANPRQAMYLELAAAIKPLAPGERAALLDALATATSVTPHVRPENRPMTAEQVRDLDATPGVRVGGHTLTHQLLSARTAAEQRSEIVRDREALGEICGRAIESFSYPYGTHTDYTAETIEIVRGAGFANACANHPGVAKPWTSSFQMPRNVVLDWDAETFRAKVEHWFNEPS